MKGKIGPLPPAGTAAKAGYDWDAAALLARKNPGDAVLAGEDVRDSLVKSVRGYRREPFRSPKGRISIHERNSYIKDEDGRRYSDLYFVWIEEEN